MHPRFSFRWIALAAFLCFFIIAGCGGDDGESSSDPAPKPATGIEGDARIVFDEAKTLLNEGKDLEAAKKFDEMDQFKGTETYAEAEAYLRERGTAMGDAVIAWTIRRLFNIKNRLLKDGKIHHPDGEATVPLDDTDGWGNKIWVVYARQKRWVFVVSSAGPDQVFKTDDDLSLYHRIPSSPRKNKNQKEEDVKIEEGAVIKIDPENSPKEAAAPDPKERERRRPVLSELTDSSTEPEEKPEVKEEKKPAPEKKEPTQAEPKEPVNKAVKPGKQGESSVDLQDLLNQ